MKLRIKFGVFSPPLLSQLGHQGVNVPTKLLDHWQRDADAISRLSGRGWLTDKETHQARARLFKAILRHPNTKKAKR